MSKLIIAIDGPSGSGKSTIARRLAAKLKLKYLDTGALYRAAALKAQKVGLKVDDTRRLPGVLRKTKVRLEVRGHYSKVFLDGEDVSLNIRTPSAALAASKIAVNPKVREVLAGWQRQLGRGGGIVAEGRDIGTVIFPKADVKFFITAGLEERARRRFEEFKQQGGRVEYKDLLLQTRERDIRDRRRKISPLKRAKNAIVINTTGLSIGKVLATMERAVAQR